MLHITQFIFIVFVTPLIGAACAAIILIPFLLPELDWDDLSRAGAILTNFASPFGLDRLYMGLIIGLLVLMTDVLPVKRWAKLNKLDCLVAYSAGGVLTGIVGVSFLGLFHGNQNALWLIIGFCCGLGYYGVTRLKWQSVEPSE